MKIVSGPYWQNVTSYFVEYEASRRLGWSAYEGRPQPTYPHRVEDKARGIDTRSKPR